MKMKILAVLVFGITLVIVTLYPGVKGFSAVTPLVSAFPNDAPAKHSKIEVVFVLDTTGSMSGLIQAAKEKIWSIAGSMASADSQPEIRMGLVAYRDRGDDYVTRIVDLSEDLDTMYATLMDFQANGGGDGPESVNQALHDAIHKISWSQAENVYRVVFLVGDAPPHMDYPDDVKFPGSLAAAVQKGIIVNAIQCGQNQDTGEAWQQVAQLGYGKYLQVEQGGNAVAVKTPYDEKLAELSASLDSTRLYYGTAEEKARKADKLKATEKLHQAASVESQARRAAFNASKSGDANLAGKGDLVDDVSSGRMDLADIEPESLPEPMKPMAQQARAALIKEKAELRGKLKKEIQDLAAKRSEFMKEQLEERDGAKDSLDQRLYDVVREQAAKKGLTYASEAPAY
ncbi:MAG: VWA domain-containing protein [Methylococcaceae bacterium]|nr:VWA domain-containing protein [Methylococcaceae bacterium]